MSRSGCRKPQITAARTLGFSVGGRGSGGGCVSGPGPSCHCPVARATSSSGRDAQAPVLHLPSSQPAGWRKGKSQSSCRDPLQKLWAHTFHVALMGWNPVPPHTGDARGCIAKPNAAAKASTCGYTWDSMSRTETGSSAPPQAPSVAPLSRPPPGTCGRRAGLSVWLRLSWARPGSTGSAAVARGLGCSAARGVTPDPGSEPGLLPWQVGSLPAEPPGEPPESAFPPGARAACDGRMRSLSHHRSQATRGLGPVCSAVSAPASPQSWLLPSTDGLSVPTVLPSPRLHPHGTVSALRLGPPAPPPPDSPSRWSLCVPNLPLYSFADPPAASENSSCSAASPAVACSGQVFNKISVFLVWHLTVCVLHGGCCLTVPCQLL